MSNSEKGCLASGHSIGIKKHKSQLFKSNEKLMTSKNCGRFYTISYHSNHRSLEEEDLTILIGKLAQNKLTHDTSSYLFL